MQVWSLLGAAGLLGDNWRSQAAVSGKGSNPLEEQHETFPEVIIVGFSKVRTTNNINSPMIFVGSSNASVIDAVLA